MERNVSLDETSKHRDAETEARAPETGKPRGVALVRRWWTRHLMKLFKPQEPASRSYRFLARQLQTDLEAHEAPRLIALTSSHEIEADTEVALMLAFALQDEFDARVLIIDATFGTGGPGAPLGLLDTPGFMDAVYTGQCEPRDLIAPTARRGVSAISAGRPPVGGFPPLKPEVVRAFLEQATSGFDYVLVQQGPALKDTRHILVASQMDLTLILVQENVTMLEDLERCQRALADNQIPDFRVVMLHEQ